jgi:receptor expression-enhancing protein 5/6
MQCLEYRIADALPCCATPLRIPFYFFFKVGFLVWAYHPSTQGSTVIYNSFIKPYIAPHVSRIDSVLKSTTDAAKSALNKIQ